MSVRLHQLEGFYYVGIEGGYARAAQAMPYPITEPAVYQQVRKLEGALGRPLVQQVKPRRTILTPEGRALHDFVTPFFKGLSPLVEAVKRGETSRLVVAVDGNFARDLTACAVATLRAKRPGLVVRIAERTLAEVADLVRSGDADVGLSPLPVTGGPLREEPLLVVRIALCVPPGHPLGQKKKPPAPQDLDGVPLCVYERGTPGRTILERAFSQAGLRLRIAAEATSFETLQALVAAGVGPAFVPVVTADGRGAKRAARADGVQIHDMTGLMPGEPVRYGLITRPGPLHPVVRELETQLRAQRGAAGAT